MAECRRRAKYATWIPSHFFQPVAVESSGSSGPCRNTLNISTRSLDILLMERIICWLSVIGQILVLKNWKHLGAAPSIQCYLVSLLCQQVKSYMYMYSCEIQMAWGDLQSEKERGCWNCVYQRWQTRMRGRGRHWLKDTVDCQLTVHLCWTWHSNACWTLTLLCLRKVERIWQLAWCAEEQDSVLKEAKALADSGI